MAFEAGGRQLCLNIILIYLFLFRNKHLREFRKMYWFFVHRNMDLVGGGGVLVV